LEKLARFPKRTKQDWIVLGLSLSLAAVIGISWILIIKPWDHHDEPQHMQYVRWLIDQGTILQPGEEDWHLNRQILKSMIWTGFVDRMNLDPSLPPPKQVVFLPGYTQSGEPPGYYLISSTLVRLVRNLNVNYQLAVGRLVSWFFFILTVFAAWGLSGDLTSHGHPLRWMVPISVACLPGMVDIMTAVNNDSMAIAVVSFFLWFSCRLIMKGFNWWEFVGILVLAVLSWFTKSSAAVALLLLPIVFILTFFRGRLSWIVYSLLGLSLVVGFLIIFQKDDSANFYRSSSQTESSRSQNPKAIHGNWVFQVSSGVPLTPEWMPPLFQPIPLENTGSRLGKDVTLGVWMWADRPVTARTPVLATQGNAFFDFVQLTTEPVFYTVKGKLDENAARLWVSVDPKPVEDPTALIYYDGFVLAEGIHSLDSPPVITDNIGNYGTWDGEAFTNLLRNGSAEKAGWRIRSSIDSLGARFLPDHIRPSFILASILDWKGAGWYYSLAYTRMFITFWGYFGWAHIPLLLPGLYQFFQILFYLSILGVIFGGFRHWRTAPWNVIIFLGLAVFISWVGALSRGVVYMAYGNMFFPVSRYAAPVGLALIIAINRGWLEIFSVLQGIFYKLFKRSIKESSTNFSWLGVCLFSLGWIGIYFISIISVNHYYGGF